MSIDLKVGSSVRSLLSSFKSDVVYFTFWSITTAFLASFQGFFAALFYCFCNKEVNISFPGFSVDKKCCSYCFQVQKAVCLHSLYYIQFSCYISRVFTKNNCYQIPLEKSSLFSISNSTLDYSDLAQFFHPDSSHNFYTNSIFKSSDWKINIEIQSFNQRSKMTPCRSSTG